MIENESQHLSILKIEYEMLALINSEILMFLFIDFLDFKDVCFCILGTKKKKSEGYMWHEIVWETMRVAFET